MPDRRTSDAVQKESLKRHSMTWSIAPRVITAIVTVLFLAASPMHAEGSALTIRFSTQLPPTMANYDPIAHFKDRVEKASGGNLVIEIHHSAELYSDSQVAAAVTSGAVEMGFVSLSRYADTIPMVDVFQLPFLFNTDTLANSALSPGSEVRTIIEQILLRQAGSRVLWWMPLGQTIFLSNDMSVSDPKNIAGKKVRVFGPVTAALISQCGGVPKDVGVQEQQKAYETHEVDVGMSGIATVVGRKLWKSMNTLTRTNHAAIQYVVVINGKIWQGLSLEQRTIVTEAARVADSESQQIEAGVEAKVDKNDRRDRGPVYDADRLIRYAWQDRPHGLRHDDPAQG